MNNETKTRDRFIILLPGFCYYCLVGNSFLTSAQHEGTTQTHSWDKECQSRRVESCEQAKLRMDIASEMDQDYIRPWEPTNDRCCGELTHILR
jgi:hypothetical protein